MTRLIDPNSAIFLAAERKNQPMHVAGLQLFEPPPGADPDFIRAAYERAVSSGAVAPLFLGKPARLFGGVGPWTWVEEEQMDLGHHLRHGALPRPGRIRDLLDLVSRLHSQPLSRDRPLWEAHVIEGLADGRFAIYTKIHHSLVDGISAMRLLERSLSTDPDEREMPFPFERSPVARSSERAPDEIPRGRGGEFGEALRSAARIAADAAGMPAALTSTLSGASRGRASSISLGAPRSIFNVPIGNARRFAADSWPLERLSAVAKATGSTLNDVVLAMCAGALRSYLKDMGELPDTSLVAMVPVGLASRSRGASAGNAVGMVMTKLATDIPDPGARLGAISASMRAGKDALAEMSPMQILALSALGVAPALALPALGLYGVNPPFNLVISNVPGANDVRYFNGARLTDIYPVSIPFNGNAFNITCNSYAGNLGFGLIGCRRAVPSLQRILRHLEGELIALEVAAGLGGRSEAWLVAPQIADPLD